MTGDIDPKALDSADKVLWCVYGHTYWPQIMCCKLHDYEGDRNIWGYSVWKNKPGFRTLGKRLSEWYSSHDLCLFFDDQQLALDYLKKISTPKCDVNGDKIKKPSTKEQLIAALAKAGIDVKKKRTVLSDYERECLLDRIAQEGILPQNEKCSLHWWSEEYIIDGKLYEAGGQIGAKYPEMIELIETIG